MIKFLPFRKTNCFKSDRLYESYNKNQTKVLLCPTALSKMKAFHGFKTDGVPIIGTKLARPSMHETVAFNRQMWVERN